MSNPFNSRSPRPLPQPPARRIQTAAGARLSAILEDGNSKPAVKSRSSLRSSLLSSPADPFRPRRPRSWILGSIGGETIAEEESHAEKGPTATAVPKVSVDGTTLQGSVNSGSSSSGERTPTEPPLFMTRRGGWRRLALFAAITLVMVVALVLGLVLGLKKSGKSSQSGGQAPAGETQGDGGNGTSPFPLGTWNVQTFLTTVESNCSSNSATWSCFPYQTFGQNAGASAANFSWVVSSTNTAAPSNSTLQIMSSQDVFGITFSNTPLILANAGQDDEAYTFNLTQTKQVDPTTGITGDGGASTCFYNATILSAWLYTRMNATLSAGLTTGSSGLSLGGGGSGSGPQAWPYAARVEQVATAGQDVPNCYVTNNLVPGANITTLTAQSAGEQCSCVYENYQEP